MGSGVSKIYKLPSQAFYQNIQQYSQYYNSLHLSEDDVWKLYQIFQEIDREGLGYLKITDILKYLNLIQTKFTYKIFTIFDSFQPVAPTHTSQHHPSSHSHSSTTSAASASTTIISNPPMLSPGSIYFHQFVISCWSICTLYQKDYSLYLFNLYDLDESGFLDIKITQQIIEDIYGDNFKRDMEAQRYVFSSMLLICLGHMIT